MSGVKSLFNGSKGVDSGLKFINNLKLNDWLKSEGLKFGRSVSKVSLKAVKETFTDPNAYAKASAKVVDEVSSYIAGEKFDFKFWFKELPGVFESVYRKKFLALNDSGIAIVQQKYDKTKTNIDKILNFMD